SILVDKGLKTRPVSEILSKMVDVPALSAYMDKMRELHQNKQAHSDHQKTADKDIASHWRGARNKGQKYKQDVLSAITGLEQVQQEIERLTKNIEQKKQELIQLTTQATGYMQRAANNIGWLMSKVAPTIVQGATNYSAKQDEITSDEVRLLHAKRLEAEMSERSTDNKLDKLDKAQRVLSSKKGEMTGLSSKHRLSATESGSLQQDLSSARQSGNKEREAHLEREIVSRVQERNKNRF
ncbi:MAG: hypothetical protein ACKOAD_08340, partial [Gammaproteobacteria bacterium]